MTRSGKKRDKRDYADELRRLFNDRDAGIEAGANEHYADTGYYDDAYEERTDDVNYYVSLLAGARQEVLEYGCGTGRIAIPLADAGVRVTGVDRSKTMMAEFRRRIAELPPQVRSRLRTRCADMRSLRLKQTFRHVLCTFNTFLHLYTRRDIERFLARVHDHLDPGGTFIFDVALPDVEELDRAPERVFRSPSFSHPGVGPVRYGERFDYDPLRQVLYVTMEFEAKRNVPDHPKTWATVLTHRQFFPQELEALLHYNGFSVTRVDGDFQDAPPEEAARIAIFHCKRRRGFG